MNNYMIVVSELLSIHMDKLLLGVLFISLVTLISFMLLNAKLSRVIKRYNKLMEGAKGEHLEGVLAYNSEELKRIKIHIEDIDQKLVSIERDSLNTISRIYTKRYNAFPEVSGDLSFSAILLNKHNTGIVITSIYGWNENRVYLKSIVKGECDTALSREEKEVISMALDNYGYGGRILENNGE